MRRAWLVLAGLAVAAVGAFVEELVRPRRAGRGGSSRYVAPAPAADIDLRPSASQAETSTSVAE